MSVARPNIFDVFHINAKRAMHSGATIYNSPDRICFSVSHIGDRMCDVVYHKDGQGRQHGDSYEMMNALKGNLLSEKDDIERVKKAVFTGFDIDQDHIGKEHGEGLCMIQNKVP